MEHAQQTDERYHLAKMIGHVMTEEGWNAVHKEHLEFRAAALNSSDVPSQPALSRDDHLALALSIQRRLEAAGLIPTHTGAN